MASNIVKSLFPKNADVPVVPTGAAKTEAPPLAPPLLQKPATSTTDGFAAPPLVNSTSKNNIPPPIKTTNQDDLIEITPTQLAAVERMSDAEVVALVRIKNTTTPQQYRKILEERIAANSAAKPDAPFLQPTNSQVSAPSNVKLNNREYIDPLTTAGKTAKADRAEYGLGNSVPSERQVITPPAANKTTKVTDGNEPGSPFADEFVIPSEKTIASPVPDKSAIPDFSKKEGIPVVGQNTNPKEKTAEVPVAPALPNRQPVNQQEGSVVGGQNTVPRPKAAEEPVAPPLPQRTTPPASKTGNGSSVGSQGRNPDEMALAVIPQKKPLPATPENTPSTVSSSNSQVFDEAARTGTSGKKIAGWTAAGTVGVAGAGVGTYYATRPGDPATGQSGAVPPNPMKDPNVLTADPNNPGFNPNSPPMNPYGPMPDPGLQQGPYPYGP